jgi:hypothetical protein
VRVDFVQKNIAQSGRFKIAMLGFDFAEAARLFERAALSRTYLDYHQPTRRSFLAHAATKFVL